MEYDNLESLEAELKDPNTAAFMVEPIQGEVSINNQPSSNNSFPEIIISLMFEDGLKRTEI